MFELNVEKTNVLRIICEKTKVFLNFKLKQVKKPFFLNYLGKKKFFLKYKSNTQVVKHTFQTYIQRT